MTRQEIETSRQRQLHTAFYDDTLNCLDALQAGMRLQFYLLRVARRTGEKIDGGRSYIVWDEVQEFDLTQPCDWQYTYDSGNRFAYLSDAVQITDAGGNVFTIPYDEIASVSLCLTWPDKPGNAIRPLRICGKDTTLHKNELY